MGASGKEGLGGAERWRTCEAVDEARPVKRLGRDGEVQIELYCSSLQTQRGSILTALASPTRIVKLT